MYNHNLQYLFPEPIRKAVEGIGIKQATFIEEIMRDALLIYPPTHVLMVDRLDKYAIEIYYDYNLIMRNVKPGEIIDFSQGELLGRTYLSGGVMPKLVCERSPDLLVGTDEQLGKKFGVSFIPGESPAEFKQRIVEVIKWVIDNS